MKRISIIFSITLILVISFLQPLTVFADEDGEELNFNTPTDEFFTNTYGDYQDDTVYYSIDYVDTVDLEERGWLANLNIFGTMKDDAVGAFYNILHDLFVNLPFNILKALTSMMIWIFNLVYDFNVINQMITHLENRVQSIAGIYGTSFSSTGLFGGFLSIIAISVAVYTLYQFIVKRASISAFSGLLKSLLALTLALVFFANYGTIIKGMNTISTEASGIILSGSPNMNINSEGNITGNTTTNNINTGIWNTFVHDPYLMLQYGTMNQSDIGSSRVKDLLLLKPNSNNRQEMVMEEITENGNEMMTRGKTFEKMLIIFIAFGANFFNSIPIMILAFTLLLTQFWFVVMAMIAPFVFLWSALPNQFGVLMRYGLELITPLILKLALSVIALLVFGLTSILSNLSISGVTGGIFQFIFTAWFQGVLFFSVFLLRKRIMNIFSLGSKELSYVREEMSNTFVQPAKKGVQTVATGAGAVAGAVVGGPAGAMTGASIGGSLGSMATGESGIADTTRNVAMSSYMHGHMQRSQGSGGDDMGATENIINKQNDKASSNTEQPINNTEPENVKMNDETKLEGATDDSKSLDTDTIEKLDLDNTELNMDQIDEKDLAKADVDNMKETMNNIDEQELNSTEASNKTLDNTNLEGNKVDTSNLDANNINGNSADAKDINPRDLDNVKNDSEQPLSDAKVESNDIDPTDIEMNNQQTSQTLDNSKVESNNLDSSNIEGHNQQTSQSLNNAKVESNNLDSPNVESDNQSSGQPIGDSDIGQNNLDSSNVETPELSTNNTNSDVIESNTVDSKNTGSNPVQTASTSRNTIEGNSMQGNSVEGATTKGSSLEGSTVQGGATPNSSLEGGSTKNNKVVGGSTNSRKVESNPIGSSGTGKPNKKTEKTREKFNTDVPLSNMSELGHESTNINIKDEVDNTNHYEDKFELKSLIEQDGQDDYESL